LLAFFIPDLSVGGAEQVTVSIVNGLVERGYDIDLLLSRNEGELRHRLSPRVNVIELSPSRTSVFGVAAHFPAIALYLKRHEPAALFPHLEHPSVVCLAVARVFDVETPIVPTHHSAFDVSTDRTPKDRIVHRLVSRLYPTADRLIAVSEGVADGIVERTPVERADISVLHNPIDVASIARAGDEPVDHEWIEDDDLEVVLFVGRLAAQKDLGTWLRAFEAIHDQRPQTRGVIVGKGPRREELLASIERLGLEDVVSLPGFVDNPYRYMKRAAVFVLSSEYEGLPTVLIEALACGCQIVSTDCPSGPREILLGGEIGHLVPVGDHAALAESALKALSSPVPTAELQRRADDFSPESVFDDYERFLETHVLDEPVPSD
jgi:glycosyltransferase involved in cell wall biosynthesis